MDVLRAIRESKVLRGKIPGKTPGRTNRINLKPTRTRQKCRRWCRSTKYEWYRTFGCCTARRKHAGVLRHDRDESGSYLRTLNIHAKDVYAIARVHRDMAWRCMTTWGDEEGKIKGVLVERLRSIPEQAAEAQMKAYRKKRNG